MVRGDEEGAVPGPAAEAPAEGLAHEPAAADGVEIASADHALEEEAAPAGADQAAAELAESGPRPSTGHRIGYSAADYPTALERFDKDSVKRLMRITWVAFLAVVGIIVVFWVGDTYWAVAWLCMAGLVILWSTLLLVFWFVQAPAAVHCPPVSSLWQATPQTSTFMFCAIFYVQIMAFCGLLIPFTAVNIWCWEKYDIAATRAECLATHENEWKCILICIRVLSCTFPWFITNQCCVFVASCCDPGKLQRFWHPTQAILQLVLFIGYVVTNIGFINQCDFWRGEIWVDSEYFSSADQLKYACQDRYNTDIWLWCDSVLTTLWSIYLVLVLLRVYAFGRGFCIFQWAGCFFGICPCPGENMAMPRWALMRSHFFSYTSLPAVLMWLAAFIITAFIHQDKEIPKTFMLVLMYLYTFNVYLFACLPAGIRRFLCFRITYLQSPLNFADNTALIYHAFVFANDAYFDDTRLIEPSKSASGPLDYQRAGINQEVGVVFVSDKETDTHVHLSVTEPDSDGKVMLVVAFRGTGIKSWANIKTDCYVVRTEMILSDDGLQFEADSRGQTALMRDAVGVGAAISTTMLHAGFVEAYLTVRDKLLEAHQSLVKSHRIDQVLVCGHSLGGALSTIYTTELLARQMHTAENVWMITFGSPRIGNTAFARLFAGLTEQSRGQYLRVVHRGDFIVGIPKFFGAFKHVGVELEVWVDDDGICKTIFDPSPLERSLLTAKHSNLITHRRKFYLPTLEHFVRSFSHEDTIGATLARHQKLGMGEAREVLEETPGHDSDDSTAQEWENVPVAQQRKHDLNI